MSSKIAGDDNFDSAEVIGQNQAWVEVTGSRSQGVLYTNDTGRPIMVALSYFGTTGSGFFVIDGVNVLTLNAESSNPEVLQASAIVPAGSTYIATSTGMTFTVWSELR